MSYSAHSLDVVRERFDTGQQDHENPGTAPFTPVGISGRCTIDTTTRTPSAERAEKPSQLPRTAATTTSLERRSLI
jgi:hypothetical protein